ncbi:MAG: hypothetical protein HY560_13780 [Gemmatimonadetes bacterium]|nr:hypothetical protein [Gemmatimonadota bacterium]
MTGSWSRLRASVLANWPLKLTALVLAAILWAAVAAEEPTTQRIAVRLAVQAPEGRPLTRSVPRLQAVFAGPARELFKLYATPPIIHKTVPDTAVDSTYTFPLALGDVEVAKHIDARVQSLEPRLVTVMLENISRRTVPVVSRVTVRPDSGFAVFGGIAVTPDSVQVVGTGPRLARVQHVGTVPLELTAVSGPVRRTVRLDTAGLGPIRVGRADVEISADVGPVSERVLMGVPVTVRGERGGWSSDPPAVIVTVRGPTARLMRLTRDSFEVVALPAGTGRAESVRLEAVAPSGVEAVATPDTVVVQRRTRG